MDVIKNVSGTDITITDSNGDKIVDYDLVGRLEQESTTGKNLLNIFLSTAPSTSNGITYTRNADGTVTANGTTTSVSYYNIPKQELPAGSYILNGCPSGYGNNVSLISKYGSSYQIDRGSGSSVFTISEPTTPTEFYIEIRQVGLTLNNVVFKPMIRLSSITDDTYEPYTGGIASPNPDYPQDIHVVSGDNTIEVVGKNLFDENYYENATYYSNIYKYTPMKIKGNRELYIKCVLKNGKTSINGLYLAISSKNNPNLAGNITYFLVTNGNINTTASKDFTGADDLYFTYYPATITPQQIFDTYNIIVSTTSGEYEPYQGNEYSITLTKNKADYSMFKNGYIQDNGKPTITYNRGEMYSYFIKVKPSTTYTFSIQETTSTYDNWFGVGEYTKADENTKVRRDVMATASQNYITFTTHSTTNYVRLSARNLIGATKIQFEEGNQVTDYQPYLELCSLGDYQDYIARSSGKNLFDKNNYNSYDGYISGTGTVNIVSAANNNIVYIDCLPNTQYTVSKILSQRFRIGYSIDAPNSNVVVYGSLNGDSQTSLTITTGSDAKYLVIYLRNGNLSNELSLETILNSLQVEKGTQATPYEPFGIGKWYLHKEIGKVVLNGSEAWFTLENLNSDNTTWFERSAAISDASSITATRNSDLLCDKFSISNIYQKSDNQGICYHRDRKVQIRINNKYLDTTSVSTRLSSFSTWLLANNVLLYYVLATPTTTEITDETLLSQLNNARNMKLLYGLNYIQTTGDLPPTLSLDYYTWYRHISPDDRQSLLDNTATIPYKINIIRDGEVVKTLDEYSIIDITYEDFRYVDTDSLVVGQFVARKVTGTLDKIYTEFEIEDTEIELQMGISYDDNTNYYSLGNFLVTKPTTNDVKDKTTFEALDYTKKFNQKFNPIDLTFPCTALDLAKYVCNQCGVELGDENFVNNDFIINDNQYTEGESCRKVMQDIGKLAYSWVRIDWNNKCYIDFLINNTIDEKNVITPNKYYTLEKQEKVFGPVNRVVIGMKDVEGENIYIEDADSIETYGVTELHIYDNNLTYTPELRQQVINAASRLFGISYIPLETSTTGHPWLQGNERIEIQDINGDDFYTYPFDRTIEYKGHIKTKLTSKADTKTETEYKNNGTFENEFRKTRIIVNKQTGDITSLTTKTNSIESSIQNIYTIDQVNELIQNAETGLTNTFSTSGGNNIFRNTGLWFSTTDQNNPYEFWNGVATRTSESKAMNGNAIVLQNTSFSQQQDVPNGTYTISFKYTKAIELSVAKVFINDVETTLPDTEGEFVSTINVSSSHINIRFTCDINGGCRIYDLMINSGDVKLAYTQNQNETTTDTVNISKGITITSSDSDVTFKANVDGIRTVDRNNTELTTFTDKGMRTKEAIIKNTSQIVGLLFQQVGEQTWITRL